VLDLFATSATTHKFGMRKEKIDNVSKLIRNMKDLYLFNFL